MRAWTYLGLAIVAEVIATSALKASAGFSRPGPSAVVVIGYGIAFYFLSLAIKTLPIGTAYAVWTGIGTVGAAILGMILFDEPRDLVRIACIFLIIAGIGGLKLTSS